MQPARDLVSAIASPGGWGKPSSRGEDEDVPPFGVRSTTPGYCACPRAGIDHPGGLWEQQLDDQRASWVRRRRRFGELLLGRRKQFRQFRGYLEVRLEAGATGHRYADSNRHDTNQ